MTPYHHAIFTARHWGGLPQDYLPVHEWLDQSKGFYSDLRHRALRHHAEGILLCESVLGATLTNSEGRVVPVRSVAERHVQEDMGWIPTVKDWLQHIRLEPWMLRVAVRSRDLEEASTDAGAPAHSVGVAGHGVAEHDEASHLGPHSGALKATIDGGPEILAAYPPDEADAGAPAEEDPLAVTDTYPPVDHRRGNRYRFNPSVPFGLLQDAELLEKHGLRVDPLHPPTYQTGDLAVWHKESDGGIRAYPEGSELRLEIRDVLATDELKVAIEAAVGAETIFLDVENCGESAGIAEPGKALTEDGAPGPSAGVSGHDPEIFAEVDRLDDPAKRLRELAARLVAEAVRTEHLAMFAHQGRPEETDRDRQQLAADILTQVAPILTSYRSEAEMVAMLGAVFPSPDQA